MRILTLCYEYPPIGGGGGVVCQGVAQALVRAGHTVDVVTSKMKHLPSYELDEGVGVHRVRCVRPHVHFTTAPQMATLLPGFYALARDLHHESPYDLCHCHFVIPSGVAAYALLKTDGLPFVLTAHGSDVPGYNPDRFGGLHPVLQPVWRRIVKAAAAITSPSRHLEGLIRNRIDVSVEVIPNGFDPVPFPKVERKNRILVATRMFERKGVQFVLRALAGMTTDWEVCIAGDGPYLPTLKQLARELGVKANFLGMIPRDELQRLFATSRVFVFTSSQENFPMVLLEAMAGGCAVVTSSTSGCAEVGSGAAVLVEPENELALRAALSRLLDDDREIDRVARLGIDRVALFGWDRVANEFATLFEQHANPPFHSGVPPVTLPKLEPQPWVQKRASPRIR